MQHVLIISKFGAKMYRQRARIPMGSKYVPLMADVFVDIDIEDLFNVEYDKHQT